MNETDSDDAGLDSDWELAQRSFEFQVRHSTRPFGYSPISFIDHWPAQRLATYQAICTEACVVEDSDDGHRDRHTKESRAVRNGKGRRVGDSRGVPDVK